MVFGNQDQEWFSVSLINLFETEYLLSVSFGVGFGIYVYWWAELWSIEQVD